MKEKIKNIINNIFLKVVTTSYMLSSVLNIPKISIFPWIILILSYYFYKQNQDTNIKSMSKVCGIILSGCLVFGNVGLLMDGSKNIIKIFFLFWGSYSFITICTQVFYNKLDEYSTGDGSNSKREFITIKNIFLIILLCWFPYWCAFFPGILTSDSISQMNQALGVEQLVNHHPIAHTLTEKSILIITKMIEIEDINISVSMISFIQMCIMALIFAYITYCIYKSIRSKLILLLTIIFYAIIPFNAYYSITLWKDILHAGVVTLLLILMLKIFNQINDNKQVIYSLYFFLLGCIFCLYRSNGYYAYILWFLPLSIFAYRYRKFSVIVISIIVYDTLKVPKKSIKIP